MVFMTRSEVTEGFISRGWYQTQGNLYFDGSLSRAQTVHPHLHLMIDGQGTVKQGRDIRLSIRMLAYSDGMQGSGGGGTNFITRGELTRRDYRDFMARCNGNMADELAWVMGYYLDG